METENKSGSASLSANKNPGARPSGLDTGSSDLRSKAGDAVTKVANVAQAAGVQAKATATSLASEANEKAKGVMNDQVAAGAAWVGHLAEATKAAADNLKPNAPQFSGLVRDAASKVEKLSKNLQNQSIEELYQSASNFTRRQPAVVFGSAALFGFFISRLLKMEPARGQGAGVRGGDRTSGQSNRSRPYHGA
jgi:ABC-type transporter Mla subunit MlaD